MSKREASPSTPHGEPRRIMQTDLGPRGNCQSACLATLLGISLSEIPNWAALADGDGNKFAQMQRDWLAERGYGILTVVQWQALPWPPARGYFICGGVSPRGNRHAVIYKDGALWHDPHPEGLGIETVDDLDIIYLLAPFAESETGESIYLVMCGHDYEGEDVKAIVRTKEEADKLVEKYQDKNLFSFHTVETEEWRIGEITDRRWEKP